MEKRWAGRPGGRTAGRPGGRVAGWPGVGVGLGLTAVVARATSAAESAGYLSSSSVPLSCTGVSARVGTGIEIVSEIVPLKPHDWLVASRLGK